MIWDKNLRNYNKYLFAIIFFFGALISLTPCNAKNFEELTNTLSYAEFRKIVTDATILDTSCSEDYRGLKKQQWFEKVSQIKIYLNANKYYRNIVKKLKNTKSTGVSQPAFRNGFKYEDAQIQFNGSQCKYDARYRLTGDLSDHIGIPDKFPHSIKIKLKNDNVGSMTKFKLLVPETRSGKFELLNVLIHKKLGFLAPRTALVNVQVGSQIYRALFQEDISKELLENNGLHESFIIEGDEGYNFLTNPKIANSKLVNGVYLNKIAKDILKIISTVYLKTNKSVLEARLKPSFESIFFDDPPLLIDFLPKSSQSRFASFHLLNHALKSSGGLTRDDHRMVYDIISREFHPIFYDGHYSVSQYNNVKVNFKFTEQQRNLLINELSKMDIDHLLSDTQKYGADFNQHEISQTLNEAISFLTNVSSPGTTQDLESLKHEGNDESYIKQAGALLIKQKNLEKLTISWLVSEDKLKTCLISKTDMNCNLEKVNKSNIDQKYYFQSQNPKTGLFIHGFDRREISSPYFESLAINTVQIGDTGSIIEYTQNLEVVISLIKKTIEIKRKIDNEKTAQVKISGGLLEEWNITVREGALLGYTKLEGSRASEFGLTGCLTLHDIKLNSVNLSLENSNCEDGVHFVRAVGNLKNLFVSNTQYDGIDADFSNLVFDSVHVINSGNDCLDTSSGKYAIGIANFDICKDKGISAGEGSEFEIDIISINRSLIGLVSKDGSKLNVNSAYVNNSEICLAVYRKKQEFGNGSIQIGSKIVCNGSPSYLQYGSSISRN